MIGAQVSALGLLERRARLAVHGHELARAEMQVGLDERRLRRVAEGGEEDDQQAVAVVVHLRALVELLGVLDDEQRQPEQLAERVDLVLGRSLEVEPEELAALVKGGDLGGIEAVQNEHPAPRP